MDFISEHQEHEQRITDTTNGASTWLPVTSTIVTTEASGARGISTEKGSIATIDGIVLPADTIDLAYCRTCKRGPFSKQGVATCTCGRTTCRRCGTNHNGVWLCRRHHRRQLLSAFFRWLWRIT